MSIAILTQVYDEMRRLAIAGSVVASGDFRLKKLIPPLEQAGAKAPVFAKVAEAVKAVVDGKEQTSSAALLELTTLVNAILYTQGETGLVGKIEPIDTTDLGAGQTQASARVLKPLLEALTTTGSGRMELVRDAYERGIFRDLRLVKPALDAIDDVYPEIADFVGEKVLPLYGKAIVPELRAKLDLKGRAGHPRRLRLMHEMDPAGSREIVKQALDAGSKEVKIVAIECLGNDPADLSYLLEQANAKAQEVRAAAYRALSLIQDDAAVAVLQKAMNGKDLELAADSLRKSRNGKLLSYVIAGAEQELAELPKTKDKKEVSKKINRLQSLIGCLRGRDDKDTQAFILKAFNQRDEIAKLKGDGHMASGVDLNMTVVDVMEFGSQELKTTLAEAHTSLPEEALDACFGAARHSLPADRVYEMFSPYLTAAVDEKKKQRDPAWAKREAIYSAIGDRYYYWSRREDTEPPLDPRWLDLAIANKHLGLIRQLAKPGHAAMNAFLKETFDALMKKSKSLDEVCDVIGCMAYAQHPEATDAFVAAFEKYSKKQNSRVYWFGHFIVELPQSAIPRLEELLPNLSERDADVFIGYIQQLREKK